MIQNINQLTNAGFETPLTIKQAKCFPKDFFVF